MGGDGGPVLFIGDSHSAALLAGARALGLHVDGASWSGSDWHEGKFALSAGGIEPRGVPLAVRAMAALRERLGPADRPSGAPVVSTLGFHLGRLVPPFGWRGHQAFTRAEGWPEPATVTSRAFLRDYILHFRSRHLRVARRWSRQAHLVLVAPPPAFSRPSYDAFREELVDIYTGAGLTVFDPAGEFAAEGGRVPSALLEADGVHGNAEYGARVVRAMMRDGLIAPDPAIQR